MTDIASLKIGVDTADVAKAAGQLDKLTDSGKAVEDSAKKLGRAYADSARKIAADTGSILGELRNLNATQSTSSALTKQLADAVLLMSRAFSQTATASKGATQAIGAEGAAATAAAKAVGDLARANQNLGSFNAGNITRFTMSLGAVTAQARAASVEVSNVGNAKIGGGGSAAAAADLANLAAAGDRAARSTTSLAGASSNLGAVLGSLGAGALIREFFQIADAASMVQSKLKLVTVNSDQLAEVQDKLFASAQRSRTSYTELVTLYSQIARSTDNLGIGQNRLLSVTETVSKAITISGVSAASSGAALVQFSQGLASGTLRGEELNSILEQTPRLAQAIAQGLGVTTGQLRAMGADGLLTTEKLVTALENVKGKIDSEFGQVTATVSGSFTVLQNEILKAVGEIDKASGASRTLAGAIGTVAEAIGGLSKAVSGNPQTFAVLASGAGWAIGIGAAAVALRGLAGAALALGGVLAANPAILALMGIGAVIGGLSAAASSEKAAAATIEGRQKQIEALTQRVAKLKADADATENTADRSRLLSNAARVEALKSSLVSALAETTGKVGNFGEAFRSAERSAEKASQDARAAKLSTWMKEYATDAQKLAAELKKAAEDFGGKIPEQLEQQIRAKFAKKGGGAKGDAKGDALMKSILGFDADAIRNAMEILTNSYGNAEKILEAQRSAGLISDKAYYDKKREFILLNSKAQQEALEAENRRIGEETSRGKDLVENAKKAADNETKLVIIRANESASLTILTQQEEALAKTREASYLSARQAAMDYFDTLERGYARELAAIGKGDKARAFDAGISQVEERFAQRRRDLENNRSQAELQGKFGPEQKEQYDRQLALLREFQAKETDAYTTQFGRLQDAQGNWLNGANEALNNYVDQSRNTAALVGEAFANGFKGAEDALVTFVTTGKLNYKEFANSIVADITRIIIKQQLANALAGAMGSGSNGATGFIGSIIGGLTGTPVTGDYNALAALSGARAEGGPVSAGGRYLVNERGPELLNQGGKQYLLPGSKSGSVVPNSELGKRTELNQTNHFHVAGQINTRTQTQLAARAGVAARRAVAMNT